MKFNLIISFCWVLITVLGSHHTMAQTQWVAAPSGLNVREQPALGAPVVGKLTYGDFVTVIQALGEKLSLTECGSVKIEGEWLQVRSEVFSGYVFGGYLLPFAPISKLNGGGLAVELDSYFNQTFSHERESEVMATQPGCEICMLEYRQVFDNGMIMQIRSPEAKGHGGTVFIPSQVMTLGQVYLLVYVAALNSGLITNDGYEPPSIICTPQAGKIKLKTESGMGLQAEIVSEEDGYLIDFWYVPC